MVFGLSSLSEGHGRRSWDNPLCGTQSRRGSKLEEAPTSAHIGSSHHLVVVPRRLCFKKDLSVVPERILLVKGSQEAILLEEKRAGSDWIQVVDLGLGCFAGSSSGLAVGLHHIVTQLPTTWPDHADRANSSPAGPVRCIFEWREPLVRWRAHRCPIAPCFRRISPNQAKSKR